MNKGFGTSYGDNMDGGLGQAMETVWMGGWDELGRQYGWMEVSPLCIK